MLHFKTFLNIYIRSFFTQGSFSHRYRQNLGFAFCMEPVGKELWGNTNEYNRFIARHSEYYNGNPFMSTLVLGAVANMEEKLFHRDGVTENDIRRFKNRLYRMSASLFSRSKIRHRDFFVQFFKDHFNRHIQFHIFRYSFFHP